MNRDWRYSYIERRRIADSWPACIAWAGAAVIFITLTLYMIWVVISAVFSAVNTEAVNWITPPVSPALSFVAMAPFEKPIPQALADNPPAPLCPYCGRAMDGHSCTCNGTDPFTN